MSQGNGKSQDAGSVRFPWRLDATSSQELSQDGDESRSSSDANEDVLTVVA